jgi:hypothetical protein
MLRRLFLAAAALIALPALAHHGWSSFDQNTPYFLEGRVKSVRWQNPHAEATIEVAADLKVPADLAGRAVPAQQQNVDGAALMKNARTPAAAAGDWELEFAPLSRMQAWEVAPLKPGDRIEAVGYTLKSGSKLMRVEYLFVNGRAYGLRSSPR